MEPNTYRYDLDGVDYYGMDDQEIEEATIQEMEAGDQVGNMTQNINIQSSLPQMPAADSSGSTSSMTSKHGRQRAECWKFFTVQEKIDAGGKKIKLATCIYCKKVLTANSSSGTRHLRDHGVKCAKLHNAGREPTQTQLQLNSDGSVSTWSYNPQVARESLCRFISALDLPINLGDNPHYEAHIQRAFCPQFQKVSRTTTRSDIIAYYEKMRLALISEMGALTFSIALTSDIWSGRANQDYLSVVAHYLDSNWNMQKRIIGLRLIDCSHNANNIVERLVSVIKDFGIQDRIISITVDNATANARAMSILEGSLNSCTRGILLHQRCACHIINLIVKSGMCMVSSAIDNIRNAISWINNSNPRIAEFKRYCKAEGMKPRKFGLDMPVRWNSTYMMLKSTLPYKNIITIFFNTKMGTTMLQEGDWYICERFVSFLEVFYESTVLLSGIYYPTSSLVLHQICEITDLFETYRNDTLFKPIVEKMEAKFRKYWSETPLLYCLAIVLDPRVKLSGLGNVLSHIGGHLNIDYTSHVANTREKLFEIYAIYENKFGSLTNQQTHQDQSTRSKKKFWNFISSHRGSSSSSSTTSAMPPPSTPTTTQHRELNKYLETEFSIIDGADNDDNFQILAWWRLQGARFPILSLLARDILIIPVSTVSSESAFSTAGRIIEERRTSLTPEMVEVLTCLKDWENASLRMQHTAEEKDLMDQFENLYIDDDASNTESSVGVAEPNS